MKKKPKPFPIRFALMCIPLGIGAFMYGQYSVAQLELEKAKLMFRHVPPMAEETTLSRCADCEEPEPDQVASIPTPKEPGLWVRAEALGIVP